MNVPKDNHLSGEGNPNTWDRRRKVLLWCLYHLQELSEKGYVVGGDYSITTLGTWAFDQIQAEGFEPTDEEVREGLRALGVQIPS